MSDSAAPLDRLAVVAAALLFSTGGAAIKLCTLSSWQVASFRSGFATLAVLLLMPAARRRWSWRTWAVGTAYAATLVLFVTANKLTTAANTIFLQDTAPLYVLLLSPWLLREPIRRRDVVFMAVLAAGAGLFFVGEQATSVTAPAPFQGNLVALAAGVTWALTIMGLRWLERDDGTTAAGSSAAAVACGNLLAFVAVLPLALPARVSATDWALIAFLGIFQVAVAYLFLTRGLRRVGAFEVSLLLLVEPVLNPVWAWLVHGETPGRWALVGGTVIVAATLVKTWLERQRG